MLVPSRMVSFLPFFLKRDQKSLTSPDAIRYLATHDNSFIRYFEGHEAAVTCLAMHPGSDNFISCSLDNTARLWNLNTRNWTGKLHINTPFLSAWDPSGNVFAIGSPHSAIILLYDHRSYERGHFSRFDVLEAVNNRGNPAPIEDVFSNWTKLEFSNDGKHLLLGSKGDGHFLLDAFDGSLKAYLKKPASGQGTRRVAPGESPTEGSNGIESSGEVCFTPDGRFVLSGGRQDLVAWDVMAANIGVAQSSVGKGIAEPTFVLEEKRETAVVAFNPRYNMLATADQELVFWVPDPHA